MAKGLLAGSADVDFFDSNNNIIAHSRTLTDSGLNMAINSEEARGGQGNILLGKYYHDSSFGLELTDQVWDLNYLALNCGGAITAGSDIFTTEQFTVQTENQLEVSQTPKAFTAESGVIGWYKASTEADDAYKKFDFNASAKTATIDGLRVDETLCIKYVISDSTARRFVVSADYVPSIVHAVMTIPLFKSGATGESIEGSASRIGSIIVDIPNFQLEGSQDLSLSASGIASVSISGSALATFTGNIGCSDHGYYAVITEHIFGQDEFANVSAIVVSGSNIELGHGEKKTIEVYKMYSDGTQPSLVDNTKLTFTKTGTSASVDANGVVTASSTDGVTTIEIVVKDKTSLTASCVVSVSA